MTYTKKRGSRPARGGIAEVVTTMHIFDLTRISRCRCTAHDRTRWVSVCARWYKLGKFASTSHRWGL